jgi:ribosomal protein S18 acetylase RimI-like enzyme
VDAPKIRPATLGDLEGVLALWSEARTHPTITDTSADLTRLLDEQPDALLLAELDGLLAGSLIAVWDGWRASLYRLAVASRFRRRGVARALVLEAGRRLRERGVQRISLYVVAADEPALAFWDSLSSCGLIPDRHQKHAMSGTGSDLWNGLRPGSCEGHS